MSLATQEVAPAAKPQLAITLQPLPGPGGKITSIAIDLELNGLDAKSAKPFVFRIPVVFAGVQHVADRIESLEALSSGGSVQLQQSEDPPDAGGSLYWRRWNVPPPLPPHLSVRYRARLDPPHPWPGPPFDLRSNGGGVSGAGFGFLVLPDSEDIFNIHLRWDLRSMSAGARGVSSLGLGDVNFEGPVSRLHACFYMAGPFASYPDDFQSAPFRSAWLGTPLFDPGSEMKWSESAYLALRQFFGATAEPPFYFFMRAGIDNESHGGAALANSFLLFAPEREAAPRDSDFRLTVAHEITHHFANGLDSPYGIEGSWFSEGLAEYYSRLVTFRTGLISSVKYLESINESAQGYYTNKLKNLPNDGIAEAFWRDKNAQRIAYQRGYFYFVDTNRKLLAASKGKLSLDPLVLSLWARQKKGERLTPEHWRKALENELGPAGGREFESVILRGDLVVPASDAFGPCFERQTIQMRVYELGFDQHKSLDERPRTVQGLAAGSSAAMAGLRNGDRISSVEPADVDSLRSDAAKRIHLKVQRGEEVVEIEYWPRSEPVEGYQWVRRSNMSDASCAAPK